MAEAESVRHAHAVAWALPKQSLHYPDLLRLHLIWVNECASRRQGRWDARSYRTPFASTALCSFFGEKAKLEFLLIQRYLSPNRGDVQPFIEFAATGKPVSPTNVRVEWQLSGAGIDPFDVHFGSTFRSRGLISAMPVRLRQIRDLENNCRRRAIKYGL